MLLRRARAYLASLAAELHPDLEASAYSTLLLVLTRERVRAADVAEHFSLNKGPVSRQVAGLERLGLITRVADPDDGRAQVLVATPECRARWEELRADRAADVRAGLGAWPHRDVERFAALLERFNALLE
ncbi:DNA-binding MarR family transcriptional regulator [Motilibacter peucedani]|uniref:DNA-binding MarR family transcriptional regulator n=1 Tax=Motilibacter peucedani TaxID=598650 RepID=A0A420XVI0_9ACTN|nr:DNA-binding MarR family transcriptional regulator [Motilibacter peucedani]